MPREIFVGRRITSEGARVTLVRDTVTGEILPFIELDGKNADIVSAWRLGGKDSNHRPAGRKE